MRTLRIVGPGRTGHPFAAKVSGSIGMEVLGLHLRGAFDGRASTR
jgi:hypothetical protein